MKWRVIFFPYALHNKDTQPKLLEVQFVFTLENIHINLLKSESSKATNSLQTFAVVFTIKWYNL